MIEARYAEPLSLSTLARDSGMSLFHFARIFAELEGRPPHRFLTDVRLAMPPHAFATGLASPIPASPSVSDRSAISLRPIAGTTGPDRLTPVAARDDQPTSMSATTGR